MFEHAFFEFHATIHATKIKKDCYRSSSLNRGVLRGFYLPFYYYSVFFLVYEIVEIQPSFLFVSVYLVVYQTQSIGYSHPPL